MQCVNDAANIIYQIGQVLLLMSLLFEDLLYLRGSLAAGFLFLLVWALMGIPVWGEWIGVGLSVWFFT